MRRKKKEGEKKRTEEENLRCHPNLKGHKDKGRK